MKYDDFINSKKYQKEYDEVVSLGFNCHTSLALRQIGLQCKSYPLDWIRFVAMNTNCQIGFTRLFEFLYTGFQDFMNESDLYIAHDNHEIPKEPNMCIHNKFNGLRYQHDFPKGKSIAESYPSIKEKYNRRIKRLMDLINSDKKVCFVFYAGLAKLPKSEIIYCTSIFYKIFPNSNAEFLILQNNPDIDDYIIYEKISDKISYVLFNNGPYEESYQGNSNKIGPKLKWICNTLIKKKNKYFSSLSLSSKYRNREGIITNPDIDYNGILSFGPYTILPTGNHIITVDYDVTENYNVFVDIVYNLAEAILLPKIELPHNQSEFKINLHLDKLVSDLEVRFFGTPRDSSDKNNKFKLYGIKID